MSAESKDLVHRFYEEVSAGNLSIVDELISDDFVEHEVFPGIPANKDGVKQFFGMLRSAFPDLRMEAQEVLADGELVSVRGRFTGTHQGDWMGMPATGRSIDVTAIDILRLGESKFTEHWGVMDAMTMMQQLGAIPEAPVPA